MKKIKLSNILLYTALALSGVWIVLLTLGAFKVFDLSALAGKNFNYIAAYVIVIVGLLLYIGFMFIEKIKGLIIPEWFKNLFYISFFIFTNVYYFFGLYGTIAGLIIFDVCLACLLNIAAVSIFYNTQKDEKNSVKTTNKFLSLTTFSYAVSGGTIYLIIAGIIKIISKSSALLSSLAILVTEMSVILFVSIIFALMFILSMKRERRLINSCLIKYIKTK